LAVFFKNFTFVVLFIRLFDSVRQHEPCIYSATSKSIILKQSSQESKRMKHKVAFFSRFHWSKTGSPNIFVRGSHKLLQNISRTGRLT